MIYTPDKWVVLQITDNDKTIHKVLAGWRGGYLGSDSWQLNSGVTKIEMDGDYYLFHGYSGSVYKCHKNYYGLTNLTAAMYHSWDKQCPDKFEMLEEWSIDVLRQVYC